MQRALKEAKLAAKNDEVPVGAILVNKEGHIHASAGNKTRTLNDPTAHAEILAIRTACEKAGAQRIPGTTLYVTLEPCAMCAAAISFARIERLVFAASDQKSGGVLHGAKFFDQGTCHHKTEYAYGLMEKECAHILKKFFKSKR